MNSKRNMNTYIDVDVDMDTNMGKDTDTVMDKDTDTVMGTTYVHMDHSMGNF
jgi:hypothetical protein